MLLFDDAGDHVGLQAAEILAAAGARVEIMTPERMLAPEVMNMNLVPYMRSLQKLDVTFTVTYRLMRVSRDGDRLLATVGSDYDGTRGERRIDQVVINDGTVPSAAVLRAQAAVRKPGRGRSGAIARRPAADYLPQSAGHVPALPGGGRGRPQHPCGDL